jgi:hypothetical protein
MEEESAKLAKTRIVWARVVARKREFQVFAISSIHLSRKKISFALNLSDKTRLRDTASSVEPENDGQTVSPMMKSKVK